MIDLDKAYTFEECAQICNKDEYYFRRRAQSHTIIAITHNPKRPWMKAIYGRDLVRHLLTVKWGQKLVEEMNIKVNEGIFIKTDKLLLEEKLKQLMKTKEERLRALHLTLCKIDEVKAQLDELQKKEGLINGC